MTETVDLTGARAPDGMRLYAIGDVHGRLDLLQRMHDAIDSEIARDRPDDWRIIHLGDYCDRGPQTRGVLDFIIGRQAVDNRVLSLRGNHDDGMLNFLNDKGEQRIFTQHGGDATARSYGVEADFASEASIRVVRAVLRSAVPQSHKDFLDSLPLNAVFGDFFFVHAGIRPGIPLNMQDPADMMWIRGEFHNHTGLYEKVIVHGHTPQNDVEFRPNRVNLDTRAPLSGVLSCLRVDGAEKRLLTISESKP